MNSPIYHTWIITAICLLAASFSHSRKIPNFVQICKKSEADINKCVSNTVNAMRNELMKGIPQMGIRPMDPVKIDQLHLQYGQAGTSTFAVELTNLKFYGVRDFEIKNINFDDVKSNKKEGITISLKAVFPKMYLTADYDVNGKLLMIVFKSQGQFAGNFTSVTLDTSYVGNIVERDGTEYFEITGSKLTVDIESMYVYFENLFPGNKDLTEQMHDVMNHNTDIIYDELKPLIQETIKSIIANSIENVFKFFPINTLFPQ